MRCWKEKMQKKKTSKKQWEQCHLRSSLFLQRHPGRTGKQTCWSEAVTTILWPCSTPLFKVEGRHSDPLFADHLALKNFRRHYWPRSRSSNILVFDTRRHQFEYSHLPCYDQPRIYLPTAAACMILPCSCLLGSLLAETGSEGIAESFIAKVLRLWVILHIWRWVHLVLKYWDDRTLPLLLYFSAISRFISLKVCWLAYFYVWYFWAYCHVY